jgi:ABC-2 type transport system ATP-binding protein
MTSALRGSRDRSAIPDQGRSAGAATTGLAPALEIAGLRKTFGETVAVDHVDLSVPRGSFFGLVGPNGAGKSTTIAMAVGLLRPDRGGARIFGVDVWRDPVAVKALVGVLPDGVALPERLTGRELLTFLSLLRGIDASTVDQRVDQLLMVLDLAAAERTLVVEYSAGMRKKLGLATALLHAPRLLVLDEPLEAVDPVAAVTIKAILRDFVAGGGSVVISSHVMALVEQLGDRVAVVDKGVVVAAGPLDRVRGDLNLEERFVRLVRGPAGAPEGLSWLAP